MNLTEQLLSRREDLPWPHHRRAGGYRVPAQWQYLHTGGGTPPRRRGDPALDDEDCAVLVEQYRYVFGRTLLEIPAGKREPGEDPLTTARRELREETGAEATHWQPLGAVLPSPGCYGEVLHLYLARDLTFGATHPDADEFLQVRRLPFDTLLARCLSGEIEDGKTVAAVLKAKLLGL